MNSTALALPDGLVGRRYGRPDARGACVVLVHGLMSNQDVSILCAMAQALCGSMTVVSFDFPGQGESPVEFQYGGYRQQVDVLQRVLIHIEQHHDLQVNAVIGHSMGCVHVCAGLGVVVFGFI